MASSRTRSQMRALSSRGRPIPRHRATTRLLFRERDCRTAGWQNKLDLEAGTRLWLRESGIEALAELELACQAHDRKLPNALERGDTVTSRRPVRTEGDTPAGRWSLVLTTSCHREGVLTTRVELRWQRGR